MKIGDKITFNGKIAEIVLISKQYIRIKYENFLIDVKKSTLKDGSK